MSWYTFQLNVAFCYQTSFVTLNDAIKVSLYLVDPTTTNWLLTRWKRGEGSSVIDLQSIQFRLHCLLPMGITSCFSIRCLLNIWMDDNNEGIMLRWVMMIRNKIANGKMCTFMRTGWWRQQTVGRCNLVVDIIMQGN